MIKEKAKPKAKKSGSTTTHFSAEIGVAAVKEEKKSEETKPAEIKLLTEENENKLEEVKVSLWKDSASLAEIYQLTGIHYAFLVPKDGVFVQCHPWIKCRDFLNDALRSHITGKADSIFGFHYDPKKNPPLELSKMLMLVKRNHTGEKDASKNTREMMESALNMLCCVEEDAEIKPLSKLFGVKDNKDFYVFEGAADWMESTFMISLYTFIIRLGAKKIKFKDKEDLLNQLKNLKSVAGDHDISYLKSVQPHLFNIAKRRKEIRFEKEGKRFFDDKPIGTFHNYTGIVSLCREKTPGLPELEALSACVMAK